MAHSGPTSPSYSGEVSYRVENAILILRDKELRIGLLINAGRWVLVFGQ